MRDAFDQVGEGLRVGVFDEAAHACAGGGVDRVDYGAGVFEDGRGEVRLVDRRGLRVGWFGVGALEGGRGSFGAGFGVGFWVLLVGGFSTVGVGRAFFGD